MKIKIYHGSVSEGDAQEFHLVQNHLLDPTANIDRVIMYSEQRYLMTLLTSGVREGRYTAPGFTPKGGDTVQTLIKPIPQAEMVSSNAWSYKIMGRIQKSVEVLGTASVGTDIAGTTSKGGSFKLYLKDNYLTPGMNAVFYNGEHARVMSRPIGYQDRFLYSFECYPGRSFAWATWIGTQIGRKTIFGGFTTFGERSRRGYGMFHYPDRFIQHTTKQRKSISLSGDVNANEVIWYELNNKKGFVYEAEAQTRAQFLLEDEYRLWWGESTMRDQFGNLLTHASMQDEEGQDIVAGDGFVQQVKGANDMDASNADGTFTYADLVDMVKQIKKRKNRISGNTYVAVTGSDGIANTDTVLTGRFTGLTGGAVLVQNVNQTDKVGGADITVGYNFKKINISGDQIVFVENPMMDDEEKFTRRLSNGNLAMSNTVYFLDMDTDDRGTGNVEIRARGRAGVNRNIVYLWENGMTGEGTPTNPVDAKAFHMLKETLLAVYNTRSCGILKPSATA
jgi:hypothetical protein